MIIGNNFIITHNTGEAPPEEPVGLNFAYAANSMYLCLF
jgi:hypothetical protein